jgi:oxygen-independent coproporphyrinogen-3 oxidase
MKPVKMGLYIHIPFCKIKCNYCDFTSYAGMEEYWEEYVNAVIAELILKSGEYGHLCIDTIFLGGGTPSLIPEKYIVKILDTVYKFYNVPVFCEITIESNPNTLSAEKLSAYRNSGINRLSIGLQACQDRLLKKLGRIHTYKDFERALKLAEKCGFSNINTDIIFGIPYQTFEEWQETVLRVISLNINHISCYSMMIEEGTVFGKMLEEGTLHAVSDELDRKMYHYARRRFNEAGFEQYEISNFAKHQYQCRHNMNYWNRGQYIGIGAGAHSFTNNRRYANTTDVLEYISGIKNNKPVLSEESEILTPEGLSEKMILGLRLNQGVDLKMISAEFDVDAEKKYEKSIKKLLLQQLIELNNHVIKLTEKGMDLANYVFIEFM